MNENIPDVSCSVFIISRNKQPKVAFGAIGSFNFTLTVFQELLMSTSRL
jgi:hypothetical protein